MPADVDWLLARSALKAQRTPVTAWLFPTRAGAQASGRL